jgi:hypothetical protein
MNIRNVGEMTWTTGQIAKWPELEGFDATIWVPPMQLETWMKNIRGPEREFYRDKMVELAQNVKAMPLATEETHKVDGAPKAYLRYFNAFGSGTWWIYGKDFPYDANPRGQQHQAFGHADIFGDGGEMGYISLVELFSIKPPSAMIELDLYFEPGKPND